MLLALLFQGLKLSSHAQSDTTTFRQALENHDYLAIWAGKKVYGVVKKAVTRRDAWGLGIETSLMGSSFRYSMFEKNYDKDYPAVYAGVYGRYTLRDINKKFNAFAEMGFGYSRSRGFYKWIPIEVDTGTTWVPHSKYQHVYQLPTLKAGVLLDLRNQCFRAAFGIEAYAYKGFYERNNLLTVFSPNWNDKAHNTLFVYEIGWFNRYGIKPIDSVVFIYKKSRWPYGNYSFLYFLGLNFKFRII